MNNMSAYQGIKKPDFDNDSVVNALKYINKPTKATSFLAYRDLSHILKIHADGNKALDYGCGTGFSTRILKDLDYEVTGTDISDFMLRQAKIKNPDIPFVKTTLEGLPFEDNTFDIVLSTFVLFDIPSIDNVIKYLQEARRVLTTCGVFVASVGSENFHLNNWVSSRNDIKNNQTLKSGEMYKVHSLDTDIYFHDYFYTHSDYLNAFHKAGLKFEQIYQPLGKRSDGIDWTTEWSIPPFSIYVCSTSK